MTSQDTYFHDDGVTQTILFFPSLEQVKRSRNQHEESKRMANFNGNETRDLEGRDSMTLHETEPSPHHSGINSKEKYNEKSNQQSTTHVEDYDEDDESKNDIQYKTLAWWQVAML